MAPNRTRKIKQQTIEAERKVVAICLRRTLAYAAQYGFKPEKSAQQFLELPRALANPDGTPYKAAKSTITKALEARYPAISETSLTEHPEVLVIDAMFM